MGFNKRFITKEGILSRFNEDGSNGVIKYFKADALIFHGDDQKICSEIHKCILDENYSKMREHIANLYEASVK